MSVSDRALVQDVIPYMDVLTHHIDRFKGDASLAPAVRAAAQRGRRMLDKYYSLTDETIIYRIAMSESAHFPVCEATNARLQSSTLATRPSTSARKAGPRSGYRRPLTSFKRSGRSTTSRRPLSLLTCPTYPRKARAGDAARRALAAWYAARADGMDGSLMCA